MSSKITQEKYDLVKIERLKHFLESAHEKGKPKFYEIFVDNLKAVDCDLFVQTRYRVGFKPGEAKRGHPKTEASFEPKK